ncbi:MAG: hypothetical protein U1E57_05905 [Paenacidovorax caeni]
MPCRTTKATAAATTPFANLPAGEEATPEPPAPEDATGDPAKALLQDALDAAAQPASETAR